MKLAASLTRNRIARRSAFTLLEVLVVVAIIVILATVASVAVFRNLDDAKKTQAQLKAETVAKAITAYTTNSNFDGDYQSVTTANLLTPPWGGTSYLPNGQLDLQDPWNKPYGIQYLPNGGLDGGPVYMVTTTADDGVHISQFGVGPKARW